MLLPPTLLASRTDSFLHPLFAAELHHKTLLSVHGALLGTLQAARAGVTLIGRGLACARGLRPKHAIKQVDRLLSNPRLDPIELTPAWVSYVLAQRTQIVVALDWTEFAEDGHSTLMLSLITKTGRATPLLWRSVPTENIQRIAAEDELIERLRAAVPEPVQITLLADRGFGSQPFYGFLEALGIDYVIRFKESTLVTSSDGKARPAREYVPASGRAQSIPNALVTEEAKPMAQVVCVRKKGMKQAWCLASSRGDLRPSEIANLYALRFSIEERFRDTKNEHVGMGLSAVRLKSCERRDRLLLLLALAQVLLHLLGAAGESLGMDRYLKANTHPGRTHSLYHQGELYYQGLLTMKPEAAHALLQRFDTLLREHPQCQHVLALL
ncbi:MAG: IS4 family transposase [Polyangia bacterium]